MKTRPVALKDTQIYTWEMEPADDQPSGFATSAVKAASRIHGEFAKSSAFMDAPPSRPSQTRKQRAKRLRRIWLVATLCIMLLFGAFDFWQRVAA
jgi:hypothetical protein